VLLDVSEPPIPELELLVLVVKLPPEPVLVADPPPHPRDATASPRPKERDRRMIFAKRNERSSDERIGVHPGSALVLSHVHSR
jgi:hypothetical protein